jgi:hypothetical protein
MIDLRRRAIPMADDRNAGCIEIFGRDFFDQCDNPIEHQTLFGFDNEQLSLLVIGLAEVAFLAVSRKVDHLVSVSYQGHILSDLESDDLAASGQDRDSRGLQGKNRATVDGSLPVRKLRKKGETANIPHNSV